MIQFRSDLYKLLPKNAHCLECGVAEGFFASDILKWGVEKLYLVDNWGTIPNQKGDGGFPQDWHTKNYSDAMNRIKEYGSKVVVLQGLSKDMAVHVPDDSLDLVYLDADHSYAGVMTDLLNWFTKLKKGGIMAGHDYYSDAYGVKDAVHDFTIGKYTVKIIPELKNEDSGFYFIKI